MKALESAINRYLAMDPELPPKLEQFDGKVVCLDIVGTGQRLYLLPTGQRLSVSRHCEAEPDATLRGSPVALFRMGVSRDVAPLLLKGEIEIVGDMRLGRAFKSMLANMRIDWEEHLAAITGDVAAHQIMKLGRRFRDWGRQAGDSLALDVGEYLQEESRDVVTAPELGRFYRGVDELRGDVDRLEARLDKLEKDRP